jgi:hypothetical protein
MCTEGSSQPVQDMNTWEENAVGGVDVRFCEITSTHGDLANLVSPYVHMDGAEMMPVDTLRESRTDIKRCLDFDICPTSSFTVRGQRVAQRVVLLQDTIRAFALQDNLHRHSHEHVARDIVDSSAVELRGCVWRRL